MCLPRFDGASVFGAMLDREAGGFLLAPLDHKVPNGRRYVPGTNILETTWGTKTGWIIVRDVLLVGPWRHTQDRSKTHRRSPTDYDAEHVLLRTMRCVNGTVEMHLECEPVLGYGTQQVTWEYTGTGYNAAKATSEGSDVEMVLTTDLNLGFEASRARARRTMRDGDTAYCALTWNNAQAPQDYDEAYKRVVRTADYWHEWLAHGDFPDHPWRPFLQRSALTLKGLSYAPTGAMVAAATTSLPETPRGERNWDYRYSWIRDSTFMLWGLYTLGFDWEANDFFYFIADVAGSEHDLQIMYGIGGERLLEESVLDHLDGYEGARPVRIGNGAYAHRQHDVWGTILDSFYLHTKSRDGLPDRFWPILCKQVEMAITHWREPDRGIWEVRGEPKHFTSSKVMCWVACDRGARLARMRDEHDQAERWQAAADEIHADVLEHGIDERGVFVQHYETTALDASLLLLPLVRFLPPEDAARPRHRDGHRRRADRRRPRAALQGRGDRRRPRRRGGDVRDLLVLARERARRDRRVVAGPRAVRADAELREPAAALRGGDRPAIRAPPGELPAGVHAPRAHQRSDARHPRRLRARARPRRRSPCCRIPEPPQRRRS